MSDDLIAFLRARLDEDERGAKLANGLHRWWLDQPGDRVVRDSTRLEIAACSDSRDAAHTARWDPARALAEVEAKRRMLNLHAPKPMWVSQDACTECSGCGCCPQEHPCPTVQILALAYVDHPEYRAEWRPAAE